MMLTIYKFELKKLFCTKVNGIALAGSVIMLLFLVLSSISEEIPVSREAAGELNGRVIDEQLLDEMKPALRYENGKTTMEITEEYEKYVPVMDTLDALLTATDQDIDLTQVQAADLYELREKEIVQRMERQGLSDKEKEYWYHLEAKVQKPFVFGAYRGPAGLLRSFQALGFFMLLLSAIGLSGIYARESADHMNQLLLCSRYGKRELYAIKLAAGFTWILTAALLVLLSVMIPYFGRYGTEGTAEMLQLVKPLSMLPCSIGHMLAVYTGIYFLTAILFAAVTMMLSVLTQNQLATVCGLMGYLLIDLFVEFPEHWKLIQRIWSLRPNAVLMNSGFSNYRLLHLAGRLLMNYQAAPALYTVIVIAALLIGRWKYKSLQVGK